jgi:polysaccharide export outer membrane protein
VRFETAGPTVAIVAVGSSIDSAAVALAFRCVVTASAASSSLAGAARMSTTPIKHKPIAAAAGSAAASTKRAPTANPNAAPENSDAQSTIDFHISEPPACLHLQSTCHGTPPTARTGTGDSVYGGRTAATSFSLDWAKRFRASAAAAESALPKPTQRCSLGERPDAHGPWHADCLESVGNTNPEPVGVNMSKMIRFAVAALGTLAGCAHSTTPPPELVQNEYRIGKEDVVAVDVWKDPALSAKEPVRPDGKISLPMIGDITAEGRTAKELQREITARLAPMVNEPTVAVVVQEINAARFFVLGEVAHPGAYPVRGVVDVLQALALAGGPTEYANRGGIVVIRRGGDGKEARYNVNYREVLSGKAQAIRLIPGDTVFVP